MGSHPDPDVLVTRDDHFAENVTWITINYPTRLNVMNTALMERLTPAIRAVGNEPDLRAVVLTGAGDRAFIGGADIKEFSALDPSSAEAFITRIHDVCQAIRDCPVPVIARINGYCLGAGFEVAASCDLRIASDTSIFGMPEVKVGVPSVIEAALLPRLIGWGKTNELLLTGENIEAYEAQRIGFLERVVTEADLDADLRKWVESIVSAGPRAVRLQKELIRKWESQSLDQAIREGIRTFRRAFETDEPQRYAAPFLNRKKG